MAVKGYPLRGGLFALGCWVVGRHDVGHTSSVDGLQHSGSVRFGEALV